MRNGLSWKRRNPLRPVLSVRYPGGVYDHAMPGPVGLEQMPAWAGWVAPLSPLSYASALILEVDADRQSEPGLTEVEFHKVVFQACFNVHAS